MKILKILFLLLIINFSVSALDVEKIIREGNYKLRTEIWGPSDACDYEVYEYNSLKYDKKISFFFYLKLDNVVKPIILGNIECYLSGQYASIRIFAGNYNFLDLDLKMFDCVKNYLREELDINKLCIYSNYFTHNNISLFKDINYDIEFNI